MSDETQHDFEDKLRTLDLVVKLGFGLLAGAFGIGLWVAALEWRTGEHEVMIHDHGSTIHELALWKAEAAGSRFTIADFTAASRITQEVLNSADKRITRVEDNFQRLEKALERIETKLGTKP